MQRESPPVFLAVGRKAFLRITRLLGEGRGESSAGIRWCPDLEAATTLLKTAHPADPTVVVGASRPRSILALLRAGACEVLPATATAVQIGSAAARARSRAESRGEGLRSAETWMRSVAHEIRNPLDGCRRFLRLAAEDSALDDSRRRWIAQAQAGLERIRGTVDRLLARPSDRGRRPLREFRSVVEEALGAAGASPAWVEPDLPAGRTEVPDTLVPVLAVLLRNALEASGGERRVRIGARRVAGGALSIVVTDEGTGIPAALRSRIGRPYFTTKPGGKGLGLTIARELLRPLGGTLRLGPSPGGGTRAAVRIPAASVRTVAAGEAQ